MNASLIIYGSLDQVSGGYLYDRLLVENLRKRGARVELLPLPPGSYLRHLTDNLLRAWPRALEAMSPDLLLQDELCHPSLFRMNRQLKKRWKGPIVAIVHHLRSSEARPAWQNRLYRLAERRYLRTVDGFVFNSETTRAVVRELLGGEPCSVVAYPGSDHVPCIPADKVAERCRRPGPLRILFTGNVIPRKGLHTLVSALSLLAGESWELTVAGSLSADGPYVRRIANQIARAGLGERVRLLDTVTPAELTGLLMSHHCLAVPSSYEGFGIVYLEAMRSGATVLASMVGAVPEVVADGREGFLVSPGDVRSLAAAIGRWIRDRDLLLSMSLAAWERSRHHPTWAASGARVETFLEEVTGWKKHGMTGGFNHGHPG
ncbi:MAG: glycosyltransferase family 4 protein [Deltaproteobacteria bacterium]|nr:glycosyltransferase family 4 protein [Deltaproteobacteria bacterium]